MGWRGCEMEDWLDAVGAAAGGWRAGKRRPQAARPPAILPALARQSAPCHLAQSPWNLHAHPPRRAPAPRQAFLHLGHFLRGVGENLSRAL